MTRKDLAAAVAGHICWDMGHPEFRRQAEMVRMIDPSIEYDPKQTLKVIQNPLNEQTAAAMAAFIEEIGQQRGQRGVLSTGGGVSNTGIPLSYLTGGNVALMAKVGDDLIADAIERFLRDNAKCTVSLKRVSGETTSYTIVMTPDEGGHSMYAHYPGTNNTFGPEDVNMSIVARARAFEFSYPPLMERFYKDTDALAALFKAVQRVDTKSFLDMHTLEEDKASGKADWGTILGNALPFVDVFCPSLDEALYIADRELLRQLKSSVGKDATVDLLDVMEDAGSTLRKTAEYYLSMGAGAVMIKCGKDGIYLRANERNILSNADIDLFVPAYEVNRIVNTTGAGDNAIAAFMWGWLNRYVTATCLKAATAAGALNVEYDGSVGAFRSGQELLNVMETRKVVKPNLGSTFRYNSLVFTYTGEKVR